MRVEQTTPAALTEEDEGEFRILLSEMVFEMAEGTPDDREPRGPAMGVNLTKVKKRLAESAAKDPYVAGLVAKAADRLDDIIAEMMAYEAKKALALVYDRFGRVEADELAETWSQIEAVCHEWIESI
jgi:hypothetical protein